MKIREKKPQDNVGKAFANVQAQQIENGMSPIQDSRPEAVVQNKLKALAADSTISHKMLQFRALANKNYTNPHQDGPHVTQLVKTKIPTDMMARHAFKSTLWDNVKQDLTSTLKYESPETINKLWDEAKTVYQNSVVQGKTLWAQLGTAIANYKNDSIPTAPESSDSATNAPLKSPKQKLIDENVAKRAEYDRRFAANYHSKAEKMNDPEGKYNTSTSSEKDVDEGNRTYEYKNTINFNTNTIEANSNFAYHISDRDWKSTKQDKALINDEGLPGSEILWQQAKLAAQQHLPASNAMEIENQLKQISTISQRSVVNHESMVILTMAYPDGKAWSEPLEFLPGTDEFFAVLGTPNARSSARFLIDHMDQLGKTIEKIVVVEFLDIKFKALD